MEAVPGYNSRATMPVYFIGVISQEMVERWQYLFRNACQTLRIVFYIIEKIILYLIILRL